MGHQWPELWRIRCQHTAYGLCVRMIYRWRAAPKSSILVANEHFWQSVKDSLVCPRDFTEKAQMYYVSDLSTLGLQNWQRSVSTGMHC